MVGDAADKAKGEQPYGFHIHSTAIRIGKANRETVIYLLNAHAKMLSKQFLKCINTQYLEVQYLIRSNLKGRQKMRLEKPNYQLGYNLTAL